MSLDVGGSGIPNILYYKKTHKYSEKRNKKKICIINHSNEENIEN